MQEVANYRHPPNSSEFVEFLSFVCLPRFARCHLADGDGWVGGWEGYSPLVTAESWVLGGLARAPYHCLHILSPKMEKSFVDSSCGKYIFSH